MTRPLIAALGFLLSAFVAGAAERERLPQPVDTWLSAHIRSQKAYNGQPLTNEDAELIATARGDVNGDRLEDLAFLVSHAGVRGGNDTIEYLVVFLGGPNGLAYCCMRKVGERGGVQLESISVSRNSVALLGKEFVPGQDAYCCPSRPWKGRVQFLGSTLSDPIRESTSNHRIDSDRYAAGHAER